MTITIETGISIGPGIAMGNIGVIRGGGVTHTVTANGNAQVSTAQVKFGTGSYTSNSLRGFLQVTPTTDFAWGTGDFTIEFWYRPTSFAAACTIIGCRPLGAEGAYPVIYINQTNPSIAYYVAAANRIVSAANVVTLNQWCSVAVVRYQGTTKMYLNGTQSGSNFVDAFNYLAGSCIIGINDFNLNSNPILGNMDEIRFSNVARYTGNYTPATEPFLPDANTRLLLHCDGTNGSTVFPDSSNSI
jgi:hypothetical protein